MKLHPLMLLLPLIGCGGRVDLSTVELPGPAPSSTVGVGGDAATTPIITGTSLTGSFKGHSVQVNDAIAIVQEVAGANELVVAYTDGTQLCSRLTQNQQEPDTRYLSVVLVAQPPPGGGLPAITTGTYGVTPSPVTQQDGSTIFASGGYSSLDQACRNNEVMNVAQSGTIILDTVGARVSGSFQFSFPTGDSFRGTFDVPSCAVMLQGSSKAACTP